MENSTNERCCLSELSDALAALEKLDDTHLRLVQRELERMQKHRNQHQIEEGRKGHAVNASTELAS